MKYIKGLDSLRALAVGVVVIGHWRTEDFSKDQSVFANIQKVLIPTGEFGVNIFFVLSGFLITRILLEARENGHSRKSGLKTFFFRRALRIFPLYYLVVVILAIINFSEVRQYLLWLLTYCSNVLCFKQGGWNSFSHTWSLSVEEQFYLLWPWFILFSSNKAIKPLLIGVTLLGPISSFLTLKVFYGFYPILTPNCFDAFGIGGLYAYATLQEHRLVIFREKLWYLLPIAILAYFYWKFGSVFGYPARYHGYLGRGVDSIIGIWILDKVICTKPKFFENSVLVFIGKISYGIYLLHYFMGPLYEWMGLPSNYYFAYLVKLGMLISLCYLSYEFFEKKVLNLKNRFNY